MMGATSARRAAAISFVVASALALNACGGSDSGGSAQSGGSGGGSTDLKVGLTSAFSGDIAYYGQDAKKGAELAIDQLKSEMPKLNITLVTADDECSPEGGASAYRKLATVDTVDVILGSACSGATLGGMPVLQQSQVPGVTFGATNATISQQSGVGGNKYSWRMNIDDSIMGQTWAKFIADRGVKTVAILAANNDFGRGAADLYKKLLPAAGVQLVDTEYYELSASDVRAQLTKLAAKHPQGLITFAEPPDCALMLKEMSELGLHIQMYSRGGCATDEALQALGDRKSLADGVLEASYWAGTPSQKEFLDGFQQKFGAYPHYNSALAYYGMETIAQAAKAGGAGKEGIEAGLAKVNWNSGIGPITFDDHNQAHPNMFILTVRNGKVKTLKLIDTSTGKPVSTGG